MINGQEVSEMVHDDVVNLIRAARDVEHDGKLVLTVQQKGKYHKIYFIINLLFVYHHVYIIISFIYKINQEKCIEPFIYLI